MTEEACKDTINIRSFHLRLPGYNHMQFSVAGRVRDGVIFRFFAKTLSRSSGGIESVLLLEMSTVKGNENWPLQAVKIQSSQIGFLSVGLYVSFEALNAAFVSIPTVEMFGN